MKASRRDDSRHETPELWYPMLQLPESKGSEMRPKLLRDVSFMPLHDGVTIQNSRLQCTLKGHSLYELIACLAPHLNGKASLEELMSGLTDGKRSSVGRLIEILVEKGFVRNHDPEPDVALTPAERSHFAHQLKFIEHSESTPCRRFLRFRNSLIAVSGSGTACAALAASLLRNGARHLLLLRAEDRTRESASKEIQRLSAAGVESSFECIADLAGESSWDMVLYAADRSDLAEVWRRQPVARISGPGRGHDDSDQHGDAGERSSPI